MDNSRRNIVIIVVVILLLCGCVAFLAAAVFGYFIPIERLTSFSTSNEPEAWVEVTPTLEPTVLPPQPTVTSPEVQPSPLPENTQTEPVISPTEAPTPDPIPPDIAVQMDQIESQVIVLRNLLPVGPVNRRLLSPEELRQKIESDFFEDYPRQEAEEDVIVLSALGLLDEGFDMFTFYQDLLSEQIAGQYDQTTKEMDIIQAAEFGGIERLTYAHEYTHALQDQNYDIENGLNYSSDACEEDSERCAAVQSLLEGDASMLELEWFNSYSTTQDLMDIQDFYQNYESPILDSAPDFLQEDFIFPYIYGQSFVEYLYNIGGWDRVNAAYNDLPQSTEQILHPERYPDDRPIAVDTPDFNTVLGDQWRMLDSGVMGEWYTYLILAHGRDPDAQLDEIESQIASEGWGGDYYIVYYNEQDQATILVMHTVWESENDAAQFYDAFRRHATGRFGSPSNIGNNVSSWSDLSGFTRLSMDGLTTTWIFAPDEPTALLVGSALNE